MKVLKNFKIILKNKEYSKLISELPKKVFGLCEGAVFQGTEFKGNFKVKPVRPRDFEESRIVRFLFKKNLFEIKGCARVLKNSVEKIDAFGPYETGPPGGVFLDFAVKEFDRYIQIKDFVKTVNIPLVVIELPFSIDFKSQKKKKFTKLGTILRLVKCKKRIEELCYEKGPKINVEKFCKLFGKNIHNLLFKAKRTHFALWDGGDVGIDGSIADYDSIHLLNEKDLADTIDGCFSTILRLCSKKKFDSEKALKIFLKEVTKKEFTGSAVKMFENSVNFLVNTLLCKKPSKGILVPQFNDQKHAVYYSQHVIERNLNQR